MQTEEATCALTMGMRYIIFRFYPFYVLFKNKNIYIHSFSVDTMKWEAMTKSDHALKLKLVKLRKVVLGVPVWAQLHH